MGGDDWQLVYCVGAFQSWDKNQNTNSFSPGVLLLTVWKPDEDLYF